MFTHAKFLLPVATSLLLGAPLAQARTVPGESFLAGYGHNYNCWVPGWGQMGNGCNTTQPLSYPLAIDTNGVKTVKVNVIAPDARGNVSCTVLSASRDGANQFSTTPQGAPVFGRPSQITITTPPVSPGGLLVMHCDVGVNATVISIEYNE